MDWKRVFLIASGVGFGAILAVTIIFFGFLWYSSIPHTPEPWKTDVIKATYSHVEPSYNPRGAHFYYDLHNNLTTDIAWGNPSMNNLELMAITGGNDKEILLNFPQASLSIDYSGFIPAHNITRISISFNTNHSVKNGSARKIRRTAIAKYLNERWPEIKGFALFDKTSRIKVILPNGWKEPETNQ